MLLTMLKLGTVTDNVRIEMLNWELLLTMLNLGTDNVKFDKCY